MKIKFGTISIKVTILVFVFIFSLNIFCKGASNSQLKEQHWGKDINGLQCSIKIEQAEVKVGETLVIDVEIKNTSSNDTIFYYADVYDAQNLIIKNEKGNVISSNLTAVYKPPDFKAFFQTIKAGQSLNKQIKGQIAFKYIYALEKKPITDRPLIIDFSDTAQQIENTGKFTTCLRIKTGEQQIKIGASYGFNNIWTGELVSNEIEFNVNQMPRSELDKMIAQLRTGTPEQVNEAVEVIKANADKKAIKELMSLLENEKRGVNNHKVSQALCQIQDTTILPELLNMYERSLNNVQDIRGGNSTYILDTIQGLETNQDNLKMLFIKILQSDVQVEPRRYAASSLGRWNDSNVINALVTTANKEPSEVRWAAIDSLGWIGERFKGNDKQTVIKPLVQLMRTSQDRTIRQRAVSSLGQTGQTGSELVISYLVEALKDSNQFVNATAATYLGRYAGPDVLDDLEQYLSRAETDSQKSTAKNAINLIKQRSSLN